MRKLLLLILLVTFCAVPAFAQLDTLTVQPGLNTLTDAIQADIDAGFDINNRVYKLLRGQPYLVNVKITNTDFTLRIVGESGPIDVPPAIIQPAVDVSGSSPSPLIEPFDDIELKNVYSTQTNNLGNTASLWMRVSGDSITITVDNCWVEHNTFLTFRNNGEYNKYYFTNSIFSNISQQGSLQNGRVLEDRGNLMQEVVIENCTFYNVNVGLNVRSTQHHNIEFNHNTVVQNFQSPLQVYQVVDFTCTNNMMVNPHMRNNKWTTVEQDTLEGFMKPGTVDIDSISSDIFVETDRNWTISNNNYFQQQWLYDLYASLSNDTTDIRVNYMMSSFDSEFLMSSPERNLYEAPTALDPGFTNYPDQVDSLTVLILRADFGAEGEKPSVWYGPEPIDENGVAQFDWPPQFDFSYDTDSPCYTAGEGGFPLGDLNWFPEKKAEWESYLTSVEDNSVAQPVHFSLQQNYPNPFNPTTTIDFTLKSNSHVSLEIYNLLGQKVKTLLDKPMTAGKHSVNWNALGDNEVQLSSGIFYYRLTSENISETKKMILMK